MSRLKLSLLVLAFVLSLLVGPGCGLGDGGTDRNLPEEVDLRQCASDADCIEAQPLCDESLGYCVSCIDDEDCFVTEACEAGVCTFFCRADEDCGAGEYCAFETGACEERECSTSADCRTGYFCSRDGCQPEGDPGCEPGSSECTGDVLLTCEESGSERREEDCAARGEICTMLADRAACAERACVPDAIRCSPDGRAVLRCDARGSREAETPCAAGTACQPGGECVEMSSEVRSCEDAGCAELDRGCVQVDLQTDAECGACREGFEEEAGHCVPGEDGHGSPARCVPGELVGCAGSGHVILCGDDERPGTATPERCPEEAPNCHIGLGCTSAACMPDQLLCEHDEVRRCNSTGEDTEFVENCPAGCAGGQCIDPCGDGGGRSHAGCNFHAVHLDNFPSSCGGTLGDCHALDAVCEDGTCTYTSPSTNRFGLTVSNVTDQEVDVTVYDGNNAVLLEDIVDPSAHANLRIAVPPGVSIGTRIDTASYRIASSGAITVHQFNPPTTWGTNSNDASLVLPTGGLGDEYLVLGWPTIRAGQSVLRSYIAVVAVEEGATEVTIQSPVPIRAGGSVPAIAADSPTDITLQQGQVLHLYTLDQNGADLSGTRLTSSRRIAAFAGNQCANVPADTRFCGHLEQQLYPTNTWGSELIVAKFRPRGTEPDVVRIMALHDNTVLSTSPYVGGIDGLTIGRGEVLQFEERRSFEVSARNARTGLPAPISVAQFMVGSNHDCAIGEGGAPDCSEGSITPQVRCHDSAIGDPSFLLTVPTHRFLTEYTFFVPVHYAENYISVVARAGTTVELNGSVVSTQPQRVAGTPFDIHHVAVQQGVHSLSGSRAIGLYVYGYDCDVSYAYPGGLGLGVHNIAELQVGRAQDHQQ